MVQLLAGIKPWQLHSVLHPALDLPWSLLHHFISVIQYVLLQQQHADDTQQLLLVDSNKANKWKLRSVKTCRDPHHMFIPYFTFSWEVWSPLCRCLPRHPLSTSYSTAVQLSYDICREKVWKPCACFDNFMSDFWKVLGFERKGDGIQLKTFVEG